MAYGRISEKQKEILEYMKQEILNKGYPPTVRDICEAVKLKSTSSVHSHLETLEKNGYIRRDPTKPRAIEIIDENFVEVVGEAVKNRRCNIAHLEPTEDSIDVSGDIDSIKAALADL